MTEILSEPPRRYTRLLEHEILAEYGDVRDVRRVFGLKETHVYNLWSAGKIEGVLVPGRGRKRGKRLFSFASIRKLLAECAAKEEAK
jgi:hypothetical protein